MKKELIAPCGMNCGICFAYLRKKNKCPGCRGDDTSKPVTRVNCKIKTCTVFQNNKLEFCFECGNFPCDNLKHLDKRYRTKYGVSTIEHLESIKQLGTNRFISNERAKWKCPACNGTICVHNRKCYTCNLIID
jgi:hypothetical protein